MEGQPATTFCEFPVSGRRRTEPSELDYSYSGDEPPYRRPLDELKNDFDAAEFTYQGEVG
jgi:hypothetical protein